jgi:hypothetical protein
VLCCAQVLEALLGGGYAGVSWGLKCQDTQVGHHVLSVLSNRLYACLAGTQGKVRRRLHSPRSRVVYCMQWCGHYPASSAVTTLQLPRVPARARRPEGSRRLCFPFSCLFTCRRVLKRAAQSPS